MTHPVSVAITSPMDLTCQPPTASEDIDRLIAGLDELAWLVHSVEYVADTTEYIAPLGFGSQMTSTCARTWMPSEIDEAELEQANNFAEILEEFAEIGW